MIKVFCDICNRDMNENMRSTMSKEERAFSMSSYGREWDICDECRQDLNRWITERREAVKNDRLP